MIKVSLFLFVMAVSLETAGAQRIHEDSLYWRQDTMLQARIDTLGHDVVVTEIRSAIQRAIEYCSNPDAFLTADSVSTWIGFMRWAVILDDSQSLRLIDDLIPVASHGDHGNWQFHFVYMAIWASYEGRTKHNTPTEKAHLILNHLNTGSALANVFYEERMIALGNDGIPIILEWAREKLVPRMNELDREMLSEADLAFTRLYDRFVMVFSTMIDSGNQQLIRALLAEGDSHTQRFARDVLDSAGY